MRLIKKCLFVFLLCGALIVASLATAQVMGPPLEQGVAEFGFVHKWFHRDMEPFDPTEMRWEVNTLFVRYGGYGWLTLSGEGLISSVEHEDFPGMRFHRFALGGGVTARMVQRGPWSVAGSIHAYETFDHDESTTYFHKRTYGVIGGIQLGWCYGYRGQKAKLWAGPVYVRDVGETYPWDSNDPVKNESQDEYGIAAGAHVVLFRYATGVVNVVYADYAQARLGFALSRGGK